MLSVVTPVYNGIRFMELCIRNVIEQRCSDLEHIIVDGESQDGTVEVIQRFSREYPHIRWISEKDQGQSDAMNKGIRMARGEVIGTLNVDDYYEANILDRVLAMFKALPEPTFLVGNCNIWGPKGELLVVNRPQKIRLTDLLLGCRINPQPRNPSAYFYHKSLHGKAGWYDTEIQVAMDLDFILRAVQWAHPKYVDELWGNERVIEGTKTYQDWKNGAGIPRAYSIVKRYRRTLPPTVHAWLLLKCASIHSLRFVRLRFQSFIEKFKQIRGKFRSLIFLKVKRVNSG